MNKFLLAAVATLAIVIAAGVTQSEEKSAGGDTKPKTAKEALAQFNSLIGGWRGTAQPRRGSSAGSWSEKAEWVWDFTQPAPAVRYDVTNGKLIKSVRLTYDEKSGVFLA